MRVPFGKFKGWDLTDIPDDYLLWLTTIELRPFLKVAIEEERAARRHLFGPRSFSLSTDERKIAVDLIEHGRRSLAKVNHPDVGGSHAAMVAINNAADRLRQEIGT
jgi:putative quorum-sensing-regulated virulence factor